MIENLPLGDYSSSEWLLGLAFVAIMFGWLVPLRYYKNIEKERDSWQKTAKELESQNRLLIGELDLSRRVAEAVVETARPGSSP